LYTFLARILLWLLIYPESVVFFFTVMVCRTDLTALPIAHGEKQLKKMGTAMRSFIRVDTLSLSTFSKSSGRSTQSTSFPYTPLTPNATKKSFLERFCPNLVFPTVQKISAGDSCLFKNLRDTVAVAYPHHGDVDFRKTSFGTPVFVAQIAVRLIGRKIVSP